ncbi:MAG: acetone carboxylase subunit gamma [Gammaproteobacteria bacterium]|nr:MAG: acetone carboxylase subunit gamma [Gammaproteobacteria bacterium]
MSDKVAVPQEMLRRLVEGTASRDEVFRVRAMDPKDPDRFANYMAILQANTAFAERILLRISDHLYIVARPGARFVKCDCGHEFGDYRINWKLNALIRVSASQAELIRMYGMEEFSPDEGFAEVREYICPGCLALLATEVVPEGYPIVFDALLDLDTFYRDWQSNPLPDAGPDWYRDLTHTQLAHWAGGV